MGKQVVNIHVKHIGEQYRASMTIYDTKNIDGTYYKMNPLEHIENLKVDFKNVEDLTRVSYVEYNKKRYYFPYVESAVGEGIYTCIKVEPTNWFKRLCWRLLKIKPLWNQQGGSL